jgi:phytoene dehydrogenase-like protein
MSKTYDAIVIGGGHNGLTVAAYLARAGRKVLVLERRQVLGGAAATEEIFPGFQVNTGSGDAGLFLPEIVAELNLEQHGLEFIDSPAIVHALQPDGNTLTLWRDLRQSMTEIARFSQADAEKFPAFAELVCRLAKILRAVQTLTPPTLPDYRLAELFAWAPVALKLKRLGERDMLEFLRVLPMPVEEFLDGWFESTALKGALGAAGVTGSMSGPLAPGTALMLIYNAIGAPEGAVRASRFVRGGTGILSAALASAARALGTEIRTGTAVAKIVIKDDRATGVILEDGTEIEAKAVVSSANPGHTFFDMAGPSQLEIDFIREVKNIKYRGSTARVNLALSDLPRFAGAANGSAHEQAHPSTSPKASLSGHILICPDLRYLERAYDEAKYGRLAKNFSLDIIMPTIADPSLAPEGQHVMSIDVRYAPYHLRNASWDEASEQLGERAIDLLANYAPNIKDIILHRQVLTPLDYEHEYGLPEGSIYHGQMGLDQLLIMRPVGGYARYRTPVENLFLCGAGTHPGGGVTGAPGYNAVRAILKGK